MLRPRIQSQQSQKQHLLIQMAAAAFVLLLVYGAGRRSGAQSGASTVALPVSSGDGGLEVDFSYDAVAQDVKQKAANSFPMPKRRQEFKAVENANQKIYDSMWTGGNKTYVKNSCWGCRFIGDLVTKLQFETVLDAGTGNGQIVRAMRARNKAAWGIELSQAVLEQDASDLLEVGLVEQGSLTNLPYEDNQFDLVFSADVLEHILSEQADKVAAELVRVAKHHIVMSISLKSFENDDLHTLLRPRAWWEALFAKHGAQPNRALVWALQQKETGFLRERGELSKCRQEGEKAEGGEYEVCVVQQPWLVGRPGQEVRQHRCITPANGELEPWMFAFTVSGGR